MTRTDTTTVLGLAAAIAGDVWGITLVADGRLLALLPLAIMIALTVRLADNLYRSHRLTRHRRRVVAGRRFMAEGLTLAKAEADARFAAIVAAELDKEV